MFKRLAFVVMLTLAGCSKLPKSQLGETRPPLPPIADQALAAQHAMSFLERVGPHEVALTRSGKPMRFRIDANTVLVVNGQPATPAQLHVGQRAEVTYDVSKRVARARRIEVVAEP